MYKVWCGHTNGIRVSEATTMTIPFRRFEWRGRVSRVKYVYYINKESANSCMKSEKLALFSPSRPTQLVELIMKKKKNWLHEPQIDF